MRILFDNVDFHSRRGPHLFGQKLAAALARRGHLIVGAGERPDVQLTFIESSIRGRKRAPLIHRLDGIWFNTVQDWRAANVPIRRTFAAADAVVYQSEFDKRLVERFFGPREPFRIIPNGTELQRIQSAPPLRIPFDRTPEKVWSCASSWRPHKRLGENIRYFREHAGPRDCLLIAGAGPEVDPRRTRDRRIRYLGDLEYETLLSMYRASDCFLHLAWLDHCPNVVVDARAAGCRIVCSSSGGTREVAGPDATLILEDEWDFEPCDLYSPPRMDIAKTAVNGLDADIRIESCAQEYEKAFAAATSSPA